jgi:Rieske Fe-S protein
VNGDDIMGAGNPCACTSPRRDLLKAAVSVAVVGLAPGQTVAQTADSRDARPQTGDRFVYSTGPRKGAVVAPGDLPLGGPHVTAYAQHPATGTVRDGSRLNEVILVRLDLGDLTDAARANAPQGYVALSAICTHAGCSDWAWDAGRKMLKCPCHDSEFDPKDDARVSGGPATRRLPRLPLKVEGDTLVVAGAFVGRVGMDLT